MGVLGLTHVFAAEMGQYGVTCNALLPGMTNTEMVVGNELQKAPGETNHLAQIPLGRMAEVEDHAKVALFLASNLSDYMTGEAVVNSGGRVMTQ